MNYYLAARFSRQEEMRNYAKDLENLGHKITSRWINGHLDDTFGAKYAIEDLEDIIRADVLIYFNEEIKSSGRNIEFGYALGNKITIILIGNRNSIFHYLPQISTFSNWKYFIQDLRRQK